MPTVKEILQTIEQYAPLPLQESYDNAGVQVGDINQPATGALLCLDITEDILDEAIQTKCNLIIAHHPLAFKPFKSLTGKTYVERCMMKAIKHDLVIYAAHTNLDNVVGGINYYLAEMIGLKNVRILSPQKEALLKLVTFVPQSHAEAVRTALSNAGTGSSGKGEIGELQTGKEVRIETVLPAFCQETITHALLAAHPYEEPVFYFYPLRNLWKMAGAGVIGELAQKENEKEFLLRIKSLFDAACVKHSPFTGKEIRKVALCSGSGSFLVNEAISAGADVFITGEAKYNDFYDVENKLLLAVVGHYESEVFTKEIFYTIILKRFPTFAVHFSNVNSNPVKYL